jgi:hypothetical protein
MLVSVIIPTVDGREDDLTNCLAGLANQPVDQEIVILRNRPTCGAAWAEAAEYVTGDYIWFCADDVCPDPGFLAAMMEACDAGKCPAATVYEGDGLLQSAGIEGMDCHKPANLVDWMAVSHTATPFMDREQWALYLEGDWKMLASLHYCSDMLHSYLMRIHGYETVVRTPARLMHYNSLPGRGAGMGQHERTAIDRAAYEKYTAAR